MQSVVLMLVVRAILSPRQVVRSAQRWLDRDNKGAFCDIGFPSA
ncbi:hypothetical protein chiPu_0026992, partial [Chiloscyllium punctatum]|nr:hypothetical protein [Chiloscyllium punctatum]